MDTEREILNCARDGELDRLKAFLDLKPKDEISLLVSASFDGSTPLTMACKNGHLDVVSYLIEECNADIERSGSVMIGVIKMPKAPPLWCAAAAGHLNVVKYLLRCKASVNSTASFYTTPLFATCIYGHFEVAKYLMEHGADIEIPCESGDTCLMKACGKEFYEISKYLVECGADINRKNKHGSTALHDCAESGNLDLLKLLLQNGAYCTSDDSGITPLLCAAAFCREDAVEYLIQHTHCTRQEKIDAYELLGASFAHSNQGRISVQTYWRQAMDLRYHDANCPIEKPEVCPPLANFVNATEFRTLSQLEDLRLDPAETGMQALLVRERILGPSHNSNKRYIRKVCEMFINRGNFDRSMQLWMYALETLTASHPEKFVMFLKRFTSLMSESLPFNGGFPVISFQNVLHVFKRALKEMERTVKAFEIWNQKYTNKIIGYMFINIFLLGLMCGLQSRSDKNESLELKESAHQLVQLNPRTQNGWTVLHFACFGQFLAVGVFILKNTNIQLEVVNLLLEVGASPNVLSKDNSSPLHLAAAIKKPFAQDVFKSLLRHGAHLDLCNGKKETPLQLAHHIAHSLDINPLRYVNLQCLSAKAVHVYNIPYKGFVHKNLEVFLDLH